MRTHLLVGIIFMGLIAGSRAAYAGCPNGSNTSTSGTFCNTNTLTIENNAAGPTQNSMAVAVSGLSGAVSSVTVTLNGYTVGSGTPPEDAVLMLVSPGGQALTFFGGDCGGGGSEPNGLNITLADIGTSVPPNTSYNAACTSATYEPYVNEVDTQSECASGLYSSPAPTSAACANNPSGSNTFTSVFTGATPNGTWTIYSYDQTGTDVQSITGGISLMITTEVSQSATTTSVSVNPTEVFNSSPNNSSTFTATVTSGGNGVNEGQVQFYDNGATAGTPVAVSGGQAQLNDIYGSATPEGLHQITATYTDTASTPKYETSNDNSNPADLFIDNHTVVSNNGTTFCNPGTITIPSTGNQFTSPYPQHVFVDGLSGSLAGVTLALNNIDEVNGLHDWKALLVAPDGTSFAPMVQAGGYANASGLTINLSDTASSPLAVGTSDTAPTNNGTYLPTAYSAFTWPTQNQVLFAPPQSGYAYPQTQGSTTFNTTFASENINNPTSPWSLYISDETGDSDTIGGYCLTFAVNSGVASTTSVSASPNPAITNTQVSLKAHVTSGGNPVTSGSVKFEQQGNPTALGTETLDGSGNASLNFTPTSEGSYGITAIYSGVSGTFNQSQGSTTLQVDNQTTMTSNGNNNYSYCNPGPIAITASTNHTPQQYPSRVLVSNLAGSVSSVTLTLDSLSYSNSLDLAMLLDGPGGNNVGFWGNIGSADTAITNQNFTIEDGATALPESSEPVGGTYAPTAYSSPNALTFASPAPSSPNLAATSGTATLDGQFSSTDPNGYWSFFVEELTAGGDTGSVGEHCVNITVTPPVLAINKTHNGTFTQGDASDTYTITVTNNGPGSTAGTLNLADTLPSGMSGVSMSETANTGGGTGSDWSCSPTMASCSRATPMPPGESDTITLTVSVSYSTATGTNAVTNSVSVSGGGISATQTATDQTTINVGPGYVLSTSVNPSGAGTVAANPNNSAGMMAGHYVPGTVVTLTGNASSGYVFSSWSGSSDLSSTSANPTTITMNSPTESTTANFVVNNVNVTISTSPSGLLVSVDGGAAQAAPVHATWQVGTMHTIATTSPQGSNGRRYTFTSWSDGTTSTTDAITLQSGTTSYTANFSTSYLLTTGVSPSATDGSASVNPPSPTNDGYYATGTQVTLTASANTGYNFSNWTGTTASSTNPLIVTMNSPVNETANFVVNNVNVTIGTLPSGLLASVDGGTAQAAPVHATWQVGTMHTIATTSPQTSAGVQYTFSTWSDGGAMSHQVTAVSTTTSYTASFNTTYPLTTAANPSNEGTVTPASGSYYAQGTVVNLKATPNTNYVFLNWTGNVANANSASTTTTIGSAPQSVTANFAQQPPTISKAFSPTTIVESGTSTLTFTITNPTAALSLSGIAFSDTFPAGLQVASSASVSNSCGGTFSAPANSGTVILNGGSLAGGKSCTVSVKVTGTTGGLKNNITGSVSATQSGAGTTSNTATLTVIGPPTVTKAFGAPAIGLGGTTSLTFTITNPNPTTSLSTIQFTDPLPSGLFIATPSGLTNSCGGVIVANAGTGEAVAGNISLAAGASCTFSIEVVGTSAGTKNNATSSVTSHECPVAGAPATATVVVSGSH